MLGQAGIRGESRNLRIGAAEELSERGHWVPVVEELLRPRATVCSLEATEATRGTAGRCATREPLLAILVVDLPLLLVRQNLVGLRNFLEPFLW